jgi:hypothetical protein
MSPVREVNWKLAREGGAGAPPFRTWKISCSRCAILHAGGQGFVTTICLRPGDLEEWLMERVTCPSGKHTLATVGEGLSAEVWKGELKA